jgi:hypothetical protein
MLFSIVTIAIAVASCSLPEQGFATHYFGGSIGPALKYAVVPATDFSGQTTGATSANGRPTSEAYLDGTGRLSCESVARQRASDVAYQDYDEAVQKSVYDAALSDCQAWRARH